MKKENKENRLLLVSKEMPFSFVEAYKSLRTNLQFASLSKKIKKIIVTSSIPGEGKTTVAINLAIALAEAGHKVVLVDCDLRKPHVHRYLRIGMNKLGGVTSILAEKLKIDECVLKISNYGIYVLTSGPIPPNPAELLGTQQMNDLISELGQEFDYVIIDTPPVSVVTDAAVLSKIADGVVFVVRQNYTKIETAQLAKKHLENVGANVIGCVLNAFKVDKTSKSYAYYQYKNSDYSYK